MWSNLRSGNRTRRLICVQKNRGGNRFAAGPPSKKDDGARFRKMTSTIGFAAGLSRRQPVRGRRRSLEALDRLPAQVITWTRAFAEGTVRCASAAAISLKREHSLPIQNDTSASRQDRRQFDVVIVPAIAVLRTRNAGGWSARSIAREFPLALAIAQCPGVELAKSFPRVRDAAHGGAGRCGAALRPKGGARTEAHTRRNGKCDH